MEQETYMKYVADKNYERFLEQGFATAGHNGPHGHQDTPVRNTAHYLIIYSYLYKTTLSNKYKIICQKFADYLYQRQLESVSGAVKCMVTDKFDHLNGLIGQGWVIEGLLYYYDVFHDIQSLNTAKNIFFSQKYDWKKHLWHRVELDGTDIGVDPTYNHHVWFAACSYKLADYLNDTTIDNMIIDFLSEGTKRDFRIYTDGLLRHNINTSYPLRWKTNLKKVIRLCLTPIKSICPKKFDQKYMERAYHVFDLYGFTILREKYPTLQLFSTTKFKKALAYAKDVTTFTRNCGAYDAINLGDMFNVYSYSYNCPAFEYPYLAEQYGFGNEEMYNKQFALLMKLMYNKQTKMFTRNNPDIETWNARTYEIIRYLDQQNTKTGA